MKAIWLIWVVAALMGLTGVAAHAAPGTWEQPASALADQIAAILGPGQAHLTIRNLSTISNDEIPVIRRLLTQDLKAHGVVMAGAESANTIRVTLSESARERMLVAEVGEGTQSQVAMVDLGPIQTLAAPMTGALLLRSQQILVVHDPALAILETPAGLVTLEPGQVVIYAGSPGDWREKERIAIEQRRQLARDPRGVLVPTSDSNGFEAFLAGMKCTGSDAKEAEKTWTVKCSESDDPWPLGAASFSAAQLEITGTISAFYNSARNYFIGVVSPKQDVDLPAFYSGVILPRSDGLGLLIGGVDGKVQLAESGALKVVSGTRDWGSDFAVLRSGCGAGVQVIASSSGEAPNDSLRAYELPALEAVPASAPLAIDGTVTALWTAPDGKSVLAVVRNAANEYEVDRVTALCN
jgi:hypothetical protein